MQPTKLQIAPIVLKPEEKRLIATLREEFRRWYGRISVNELVSNRRLVQEIEEIEKLLSLVPGAAV